MRRKSSEKIGLNFMPTWHYLYILSLSLFFLTAVAQPSYSKESELKKATLLTQQLDKLRQQGQYAKAIPIAEELLMINEKHFGLEHYSVAAILSMLGDLYFSLANYNKAEPLYKRSLAIFEKSLGLEHPYVARSLKDLAALYCSLGDYSKAEPLYRRALAISEKAHGSEHPDVALILDGLALLYCSLGDYSKAEPLFKRALAIKEKAHGSEHPEVATCLNNLANLYSYIGNYNKAEPLFKRSLAIAEKTLGPEHPYVARSLNGLALLYRNLGDYSKAESLCRRALAIAEKDHSPEHPEVVRSLHNLATLYHDMGKFEKAEPILKRSLAIAEKTRGPEHPEVATCLLDLANFYYFNGYYNKAELLLKKSLAITEKAFGPENPEVATCLNNLAAVYRYKGDFEKAELLLKKSLAITEKAFGPEHPHVALSLDNLATLYGSMGEFEKAKDLFKQAQRIDSKLIEQVMRFTSEEQKFKFLSIKKWNLYRFLSLVSQYLAQIPAARRDALDTWLRRKGVILEAQKRFQEALVYSDEPEAMKIFQELSRIRSQLSKLTFAGPGKENLTIYKKKIATLKVQKSELEAKLSQLSQAFAVQKKIAKANCEKVAKSLPANTVLIEFALVEMFNFRAKRKEKNWDPYHYLAFVLHAGKGDKVGFIDLGDAEKIDKTVAKLKKEISIMEEKAIKSSRKVYRLVFEPLRKELGDVKEIFISPDGNLNLIPFEVLQGPDGRYLIEDYTFNYLSAGRDVLGFGQIKGKGEKALLMGDPDFDMGSEEKNSTLRKLVLRKSKQKEITRRSLDMKVFHFKRLPGTLEEVKAIHALLGEDKAALYTGKEALEEVLRQSGTPRILHLATHGFFLKDQDFSNIPVDLTKRAFSTFIMPVKEKGKKVRIETPMLRSGFALAGANSSLQTINDEQVDDGIVTAEEILGLRLRGTDMVVLSACDTGLGEVNTGEGVFGLRRAFAQAGVKSLIMSLWAVPDKETREMMIEFYKNIISGKMNRCQALRQAALKEMKIVKKRYGHAYPLCWGGFVMVGDPGKAH